MEVFVKLKMPEPGCSTKQPAPPPLEDKVRQAIELIDSGYCSHVEWLMINKLYRKLCGIKQTPRVVNLKKMIEPVLAKYGYHKVTTSEDK